MTNTIPYRRTKTHIWDKVLMGFWVHPIIIIFIIIIILTIIIIVQPGITLHIVMIIIIVAISSSFLDGISYASTISSTKLFLSK